jgi:hypothetical protein
MRARRGDSVAALVVGAAALLMTCVFGFLNFVPGVDPEVADFLELGLFGGAALTMGAVVAYFVTSRRAKGGQSLSKFDRQLDQRSASLAAVPIGIAAVLIGVLWYMARTIGAGAAVGVPGGEKFAAIDTAGIAAFLGFGSLYVIVATWLAIRSERAAIQTARSDAEVPE